jgi:hypothetical protein
LGTLEPGTVLNRLEQGANMSIGKFSILGAALSALLFNVPAKATFPGQNGKIVFVSDRSGSWQLYTIDPDSRDITQITNLATTGYDFWAPSVSPDGNRIVFCYGSGNSAEGAATELYVINSDGNGLKQLTNDGSFDCAPHCRRMETTSYSRLTSLLQMKR